MLQVTAAPLMAAEAALYLPRHSPENKKVPLGQFNYKASHYFFKFTPVLLIKTSPQTAYKNLAAPSPSG